MAGASSEASSVNIGTIETSSHPKIESEIHAVDDIGDSNEVCGLEKKECDEIMEHLKNNPGLVVKSLGPEPGRIVLHVAVMASETKRPKPPTSKPNNKGFSEAADDSDWYLALERKDCKEIMSLLQANPFLVAQTGPEGWTVLHAAAHRGCLQLLHQVLDLFNDIGQFVDEMSGVKITRKDLLEAKCSTFKATAKQMAWFTYPRQVSKDLHLLENPYISFERVFQAWTQQSNSDASQHLRDKLVEIMEGEPSKKAFEDSEGEGMYQIDENYNFVLERIELKFHYMCYMWENKFFLSGEGEQYVKTIIDGCQELGPIESVEVLTYLFQLHNAQGQTPFHLVRLYGTIDDLLQLVPPGDAYKGCLNAKDVRGWTVLHLAAAIGHHEVLKELLKDERVDVNARIEPPRITEEMEYGLTALHLAILHNHAKCVGVLLQCPHTDKHALHFRTIECGYEKQRDEDDDTSKRCYWSPLQLAAIMGLSNVVRVLLASKHYDDYGDRKLQNDTIVRENFRKISALLLASGSGNPDTLRLFLDNKLYDPLVKFEGATALHYAADAMIPKHAYYWEDQVGCFLLVSDLAYLDLDTSEYEREPKDMELTPKSYLGRQACITMLLQAGVDIWERDNRGRFAEPGPQASKEAQLWWHDKMAQETLEAKKSLNDAANAIAVVAALVATASFVGPLQPPLGYGGDSMESGVQDTHLSIRVFMVSNNLSFYLAIASIMFAVVPSLPMPQEGIYVEWQRTRRTVAMAIFFLLMSVLGVLISFGAASNSVVSEDYSWRHDGLSFYPMLLGGFICIIAIGLFFLRLLRLVFNKNVRIRFLYKTFVRF